MSVDAFTVDGTVNLNIEPFESAISKVTTQLTTLSESMTSLMEMGGGNWNFNGALNGLKTLKDDLAVIKEDIATMNTEFANTQGINALKTEIASLRSEIDAIKQKVNETTTQTVQRVREVKTEISAITSGTEPLIQMWATLNGQIAEHYDILGIYNSEIGQINAKWRETQGLVQKNTAFIKEMEVSGSNVAKYFIHENELLETSLNFINQRAKSERTFDSAVTKSFSSLVRLSEELERQVITTQKRATALSKVGKEIIRNGSEIKKNLTYEEEMVATEKLFQNGLGEELASRFKINEQIRLSNEMFMASKNAESEMLTLLNEERGILSNLTGQREKSLAFIEEELTLEKEKASLIGEETALLNEQGAVRQRNAMKGNQLDKMGYLPSRIGSMALTMWGFNEIMDIYDKSSSNLNARGSQKYFSEALQTDQRYLNQTKQSTVQVRTEMSKLGDQLDALQKKYQKIDMTVVGANAEETAYKYGLQADKIGDLSEVMAIYGSEFVKQGRSQEDSILALNDALDGELRRLKEVNVGKEELEAHGWTGDQASMIDALKQIADERGYTLTAQNITNLNDAIETLELKISRDLVDAFEYIQPILIEVAKDFVIILEAIEGLVGYLNEIWKKVSTRLDIMFGVQNMQKFGNISTKVIGGLITGLIGLYIIKKVASVFSSGWNTILDVLGKTKPIDKASDSLGKLGGSTNTGGTSAPKERGGFKDGIKGLAENLGKMAKVFVEVAVAIAMAWALIEEAILLISAIGYTYDSLKPQFDSGIEFIKEFGLWFALLGGVMLGLAYVVGKVPSETMAEVGQGAVNVATGLAIAMGLVAVAIGSLLMPLGAIITLGALANWQQGNLDKGIEVIQMFADALNQISAPVGVFLIALGVASVIFGYAPMLGVGVAIGIAISIGLVAEAIFMLNAPLVAIASLGYMADTLGMDSIQQGANALKITGQALQVIADAVPSLLIVDIGVFGQELMDWGSKLITGKDGLTYLSEEIIPNLSTFVQSFNSATIDPIQEDTVTNLSQVADNIPTIKNAIDKIRTSVGTGGTGGFNVMGFQIGGDTSSLKPKLDQLYKDIQDVIDFANKFGGDSSVSLDSVTAVSQMANVISQLQVKLNALITTITTASVRVQSASKMLGSAIKTGFSNGVSGFEQSVVTVLASGIREVQSRYDTWHSGGKASAEKLSSGFETISDKFKSTISTEMGYALDELDNYKDDFYNKGKMLGDQLISGFQDGMDFHSPALISRTIAKEMEYSMLALDNGKKLMYSGGVALGQALVNGYNSYGNLRTDVGVLASKGVSNEQLQANAKNNQLNGNLKGQNTQLTQTNINIDMSNSTVIGVQDLDNKIRQAVEKAIVSINSPNGAIGY